MDDTKKTLVAYFSCSGRTKALAEAVAHETGADLHEIKPEVPYTPADLNWNDKKSRSTIEMADLSFRPVITGQVDNMAAYDVIFLGFPIWWGTAPTIIHTFLESYDLSRKAIALFATSGGGGFGKSIKNLVGSVADTTKIIEGKLFKSRPSAEESTAWLKNLNLE